jgi:hypothetical protein
LSWRRSVSRFKPAAQCSSPTSIRER